MKFASTSKQGVVPTSPYIKKGIVGQKQLNKIIGELDPDQIQCFKCRRYKRKDNFRRYCFLKNKNPKEKYVKRCDECWNKEDRDIIKLLKSASNHTIDWR